MGKTGSSERSRPAVPLEMTGPAVYAALADDDRHRFDEAFREALDEATATFDLEPLSEVVRRWWVASGGDPAVAEADRAAGADRPRVHPVNGSDHRTTMPFSDGRAVAVRFEEAFRHAAQEAAETLDHLPLRYLASGYAADEAADEREQRN
ncbi:DUF6247 family protein [Yinghuangia seranimata]|uniref:DUF6247 family protein n=1 Tax=Yinghuangia seranimata TaxID=408067 RepID=UPI00248B7893|nr:DUF6247 family protein [Yinghuangia seranimata]MDI2124664.1 DUF6247 family protein [Yinghuangia seranimata]